MNVAGHDFDRRREARIAFGSTCADIIGFQEIKREFEDIFKEQGHVFIGGLITADHGFSVPIAYHASRFELLHSNAGWLTDNGLPGPSFDDGAERTYTVAVLKEIDTGIVIVVGNSHFGFKPIAIRKSMKILARAVDGLGDEYATPYRILMGDFNMNTLEYPVTGNESEEVGELRRLNREASRAAYTHATEACGFADVFNVATPAGFIRPRGRVRTFNNWSEGEPFMQDDGATIDPDYILVKGFTPAFANVIGTTVGGVMASDHFWVITQLRYEVPGED